MRRSMPDPPSPSEDDPALSEFNFLIDHNFGSGSEAAISDSKIAASTTDAAHKMTPADPARSPLCSAFKVATASTTPANTCRRSSKGDAAATMRDVARALGWPLGRLRILGDASCYLDQASARARSLSLGGERLLALGRDRMRNRQAALRAC
jgi:hypothetical protein